MWSNRSTHSLVVGIQNDIDTLEDSLQFLAKLNTLLPYNLATTSLGTYLNELKTYITEKFRHTYLLKLYS